MSAVVTGIGVVAPNGLGTAEFWRRTLDGESGIGPITRFDASRYPVRLAGEVPGFTAADHVPGRLVPQTDRGTQLALAATDWALEDADAHPGDFGDFDMGVATAASAGGFEFGQRELQNLWRLGPRHVSAYQSFAWFYAVNAGQISIRHGMRGPIGINVSEQAGGLDAVAQARRLVRKRTALVVTGAVDASLCPWGLVAQIPGGRLSTSGDPGAAYLPFAAGARGHLPGEGGAILIVEDADHARRRGAPHLYGEIAGYRATFDPAPRTGRPSRLASAVRGALDDAGMAAGDIDVVFADGAGVPELDRAEAEALAEVFGRCGVPVTAPKSMTGRLNAGGAALDLAAALLSIRDGVIPPTAGVVQPDESYGLDLVTRTRRATVGAALVLARGYGGFNAAMVVRRCPQAAPRPARAAAITQGEGT
ncbi:ketosynthase chain-length factor [Sphaerisporangium perillae]|uniref:ketosynthase chain-length factor n=1 Tax=Sphaerisporangium perillae TaxID=2935860 RepID=UPI00200FE935|nr:ketosynthase chain-length factor [Sphaerisporangium perillae]